MEYLVTVTQYHEYWVDAESREEARELGLKDFYADMRRSVAYTYYDAVDVDEVEDYE